MRRAAQHAQSQKIEAATAKQQKKVRSPYYKSSVHTGGYEPQWSEGAVFGSAHGPHPQAKSDDVQHSERGPIYVYSDGVQRSEQGSIYHFDMPAASGELVARYTDESRSLPDPSRPQKTSTQGGVRQATALSWLRRSRIGVTSVKAREPGVVVI